MPAELIVIIILLLGGLVLFMLGLYEAKKDLNKFMLKRCTKETDGNIIGFDENDKIIKMKAYATYNTYTNTTYKKHEEYFCPFIEFKDEYDEKYEMKYEYPLEKRFSKGQKIKIKYNPENPYECYIIGDKNIKINSDQEIIFGIILFLTGIILLIMKIFR